MTQCPTCIILLLAAVPAFAQTLPVSLDLEACRRLALEHNPSLRLARERIVEQDWVLQQRRASQRPHLNGTGDYSIIDPGRAEDFGGAGVDDTAWSAGIEASISVYSGSRYTPDYQSAELTQEALRHRSETAKQDVLLAIQERFFGAMLARQQIGVQEESVRLLEGQLTLARNRYEAGVGPKFDVLQAEVAAANARPLLLRAHNDYRIAIEQLRRVIGLPYAEGTGPDEMEIAGAWDGQVSVPEISEALASAMANRPELADLSLRRQAGEKDLLVARRELRPRVEAYAGYGVLNDRFSAGNDYLDGWMTGLRANWPIWNGRATSGAVRQQGSRLLQLDLQADDLALQIGEEVRRHLFDCELAQRILSTSALVIDQAQEAVRLARNRFEAGGATQLDVLQSQLALTRAQLEQAHAFHDLQVAHARLLRSLGALD